MDFAFFGILECGLICDNQIHVKYKQVTTKAQHEPILDRLYPIQNQKRYFSVLVQAKGKPDQGRTTRDEHTHQRSNIPRVIVGSNTAIGVETMMV
jgi:hypothetical protein